MKERLEEARGERSTVGAEGVCTEEVRENDHPPGMSG